MAEEDTELVSKARSGDAEAFGVLLRRYTATLYPLAKAAGREEEAALVERLHALAHGAEETRMPTAAELLESPPVVREPLVKVAELEPGVRVLTCAREGATVSLAVEVPFGVPIEPLAAAVRDRLLAADPELVNVDVTVAAVTGP